MFHSCVYRRVLYNIEIKHMQWSRGDEMGDIEEMKKQFHDFLTFQTSRAANWC